MDLLLYNGYGREGFWSTFNSPTPVHQTPQRANINLKPFSQLPEERLLRFRAELLLPQNGLGGCYESHSVYLPPKPGGGNPLPEPGGAWKPGGGWKPCAAESSGVSIVVGNMRLK